jgi:hypothetical protein
LLKIGNIFKFRVDTLEHLHTKYFSLKKFIKVLKGETTIVPERRVTLNINDKLQFLNESNTTISPDKLKISRTLY